MIPRRLRPLLEAHPDRLVILDEVHRLPRLFPLLRSLVDRARRRGRRAGPYLLDPLEVGAGPWSGSGPGRGGTPVL